MVLSPTGHFVGAVRHLHHLDVTALRMEDEPMPYHVRESAVLNLVLAHDFHSITVSRLGFGADRHQSGQVAPSTNICPHDRQSLRGVRIVHHSLLYRAHELRGYRRFRRGELVARASKERQGENEISVALHAPS